MPEPDHEHGDARASRRSSSARSVSWTIGLTLVLAGIAYLLTRHANHALQYLPLLVILACPLLHIFLHRGHRH